MGHIFFKYLDMEYTFNNFEECTVGFAELLQISK